MDFPDTVGGFSVLPVCMPAMPSLSLSANSHTTHFLYLRPNAPKIPTVDDERSLFVANVPADSTEAHFRALFADLVGPGRFESIKFEDERRRRWQKLKSGAGRLGKRKRTSEEEEDDDEDDDEEDSEDDDAEGARMPKTWTHELHRSGSSAVVRLVDPRSVAVVLKAAAKACKAARAQESGKKRGASSSSSSLPAWPLLKSAANGCGVPWLAAHQRMTYPDRTALSQAVDGFFARYNRREAEAAAAARRLRSEPDADGFITVKSGASGAGSGSAARRAEAEAARARQLEKQEKKAAELLGSNFYRFQLRERKKEEQAELQRRFQEDRKRVADMREKRGGGRFQPEV